MHEYHDNFFVGESTHIVNRIKSLTVPCGSRLMLIFFSSGRCFSCCLLATGTVCSPETVGFPTGCSYFDRLGWPGLRNVKLFGFRPGCSLSTVSVDLDCETRSCSASFLAAVSWTWARFEEDINPPTDSLHEKFLIVKQQLTFCMSPAVLLSSSL